MPATTSEDGPRAGPSFAFHESIDYLPHRDAAWAVFDERFAELEQYSAQLLTREARPAALERIHTKIALLGAGLRSHRRVRVN
jgi:hypothetical protein